MKKRRGNMGGLKRWLRILAAGAAFGVLPTMLTPAEPLAQGGAEDVDPAELARQIDQYLTLLERDPSREFIFKQLFVKTGYGQALENLIDRYRGKVAESPSNATYAVILGRLLIAAQDYTGAVEAYEAATKAKPKSAAAWLGYGTALQKAKRAEESQAAYEKALSLESGKEKKMDILRDLADMAFSAQDWGNADKYYRRMDKLDDGLFSIEEYASRLENFKRYEEALGIYKEILGRAGGNQKVRATTLKNMGHVQAKMGEFDEALKNLKKAKSFVSGDSYLRQEVDQIIISIYRDKNDLPGLIAQYESQWRNPSYEQAMTLAGLYDELGSEEKAMNYYKKALGKNRGSVDARLKIIHLLERRGETDAVIKAYADLVKAEPGQPSYQFELAELYWRKGDKNKAKSAADKLSRSFKSDPTVQGNLAELYLRWDMRDKVLDQYQKLVRIDPNDPSNLTGLGEFYWQDGKRDKALETWKRILRTNIPKSEAHATLGQVYADHNMTREAVEEFTKAIGIDPGKDHLYRSLALVHERARDLTSAVATWERLLGKTKRQHMKREARSRIIQIHHRQGQLRNKLPVYRQKFDATPPDIEAGYFLGEAFIVQENYPEAERIFLAILDKRLDDQEALLALNKVYTETSDHKKNIDTLERLAQLNPQRAKDYFHRIAELNLKLYEDEEAVRFARKMVDLNPSDAGAHARLGKIYAKMQDLATAARSYRRAIELDPLAYPYFFELAEIYLALDKVRDADQLYRQLIRKARDESMVLRAGRKSIDINDAQGGLGTLETELTPLIAANPTRKVYSRLQIELYDRMTLGPIADADLGNAQTRERARTLLADISRRALGPLLASLSEDDLSQQMTAIRILGDLRNPNAALPLARMIDSPDQTVRVHAALASGKIGSSRALQPMLRATRDPNVTIREIAVWSLGRMKSKEAIPALNKLLDEDPLWSIRALAALSLGRIKDPAAIDTLGRRLASPSEQDAKSEVRLAAAWGLGAIGDSRGLSWLEKAVGEDRDPQVRRTAAWAMGNIGDPKALTSLLTAYWSTDPDVRMFSGKALMRFGPDAQGKRAPYSVWEENVGFYNIKNNTLDIRFLLDVLLSDEVINRGGNGSFAIVQGETAIGDLLRRKLQRADAQTLSDLLFELDRDKGHLGLGVLTLGLPATGAERAKAMSALDRIGTSLSGTLQSLLTHEDPMVRAHAAGIIGKVGDKAAASKLTTALGDKHEVVRRKAALALGMLGEKGAVDALLARLSGDGAYSVRGAAAVSLGRLGDKKARQPLEKALQNEFNWVQASAAEGLGLLGDKAAVGALISRLDNAPWSVKIEILRALAALGGTDAEKALERYRQDPDKRIRDAARN